MGWMSGIIEGHGMSMSDVNGWKQSIDNGSLWNDIIDSHSANE